MDRRNNIVVDGRFVLHSRIGHGAIGDVYRARDRDSARWVAVKVLRAVHERNPKYQRMILTEAEILERVEHRNVVGFVGRGVHGRLPYVAMELLGGGSLHEALQRLPRRRLDVLGAVALLAMTCHGVQAVHDAGFAHCDLKARNVLLDGRGRAAVGDFGLAMRTGPTGFLATALVGGTADYMAPEVIGRATDIVAATVDVYALGILAFAMLTGRRPFTGNCAEDLFSQHVGRPVPLASSVRRGLCAQLDGAVASAMNKDPDRRPASPRAFADALSFAIATPPRDLGMRVDAVARDRGKRAAEDLDSP